MNWARGVESPNAGAWKLIELGFYPEIADLLRKHGGKTGEELEAEGKWNAESSLSDQPKYKNKIYALGNPVFIIDWYSPARIEKSQFLDMSKP